VCQPINELSVADKDLLLNTLGRYCAMKRQIAAQEKSEKSSPKKRIEHDLI
jgi:hypothetical protein